VFWGRRLKRSSIFFRKKCPPLLKKKSSWRPRTPGGACGAFKAGKSAYLVWAISVHFTKYLHRSITVKCLDEEKAAWGAFTTPPVHLSPHFFLLWECTRAPLATPMVVKSKCPGENPRGEMPESRSTIHYSFTSRFCLHGQVRFIIVAPTCWPWLNKYVGCCAYISWILAPTDCHFPICHSLKYPRAAKSASAGNSAYLL